MANEVDLSELERYLRIFQENPDSRVFAPLADLYRRLGRLNEAEEICREGISRHPYYAGGRVALAHVLLDAGRLEECLSEVENVVTYYPDNLLARKVLIRALGGLGRTDRAVREFEALKALAPLIAADPEIERALQGPKTPRQLPGEPGSSPIAAPPVAPRPEIFKPMEIQEKTEWVEVAQVPVADPIPESVTRPVEQTLGWEPESIAPTPEAPVWEAPASAPAVVRSQKLARLFRQKLILESLTRALGQP